MNTEEVFKCKNCGSNEYISCEPLGAGVRECSYCHSIFTLPKKDISPAALSFLRQGEHDLDTCKFDSAYSAYEKAAEYDNREPEAYWGMALAEFKVQYIRDTVNNRLQPICHEFTDKEFVGNKNYLSALKYATQEQKREYVKKATEIDYIRSEFLKLKDSGLDYDCFICVKVSRMDGEQSDITKKNWTEDAYDADAVYDLLKRNGYTPFFSEREIRGRTGADYEAMILYALYTSETMLVVCRNEEYLQTPWVKNEYTRFKELINNKEKENDSLTIIYSGMPVERLPGFNGKIQGIDYSRREADFEIVNFVENHTPLAKARREEERLKQEQQAEEIRRQIEEQKKAQRELEERLKNLNSNSVAGATSTVGTLLMRAKQEMDVRNFAKAEEYFNKITDSSPENAEAWFGLFLINYNANCLDELLNNINKTSNKSGYGYLYEIPSNINYNRAKKYADDDLSKKITKLTQACDDRIKTLLQPANISFEARRFYSDILTYKYRDSAQAHYALFLVEHGCTSYESMLEKIANASNRGNYSLLFDVKNDANYKLAMANADSYISEKLTKIAEACKERINTLLQPSYVNSQAASFYNDVLNIYPDCAEAWYGILLLSYKCTTYNELIKTLSDNAAELEKFPEHSCVKKILLYGNEELKKLIMQLEQLFSLRRTELLKNSTCENLNKNLEELNLIKTRCKQSINAFLQSIFICALLGVCAGLLYLLVNPAVQHVAWEWSTKNIVLVVVTSFLYLLALSVYITYGCSRIKRILTIIASALISYVMFGSCIAALYLIIDPTIKGIAWEWSNQNIILIVIVAVCVITYFVLFGFALAKFRVNFLQICNDMFTTIIVIALVIGFSLSVYFWTKIGREHPRYNTVIISTVLSCLGMLIIGGRFIAIGCFDDIVMPIYAVIIYIVGIFKTPFKISLLRKTNKGIKEISDKILNIQNEINDLQTQINSCKL